ncbi:MAG: LysE family translocator [Pseudomonadota bacterium]
MSLSTFAALLQFSYVASVTPWPNNLWLLSSGVNFGVRRTIPHMFGIAGGFGVLLACVGSGLGVIFELYPPVFTAIKFIGAAYMIWLAWRIFNSGPAEVSQGAARPMTFMEAALFQWVNPKAWMMATYAMAVYTSEGSYALSVAIVVFAFVVVNFPSVSIWVLFGMSMRRLLQNPLALRIFNTVMAVALLLSLWPMLTDG